jgi:choline dehydrogenase
MHRKNLEVITNAHVKKIIFDQHRRAQGVEIVKDGEIIRYDCSKEVILCAGAINTPKLLELSGIGDAQLLKKYGISLILDSPMVGRNLQDHLALSYVFKSTVPTLNQSLGTWRGQMMAALHYGLTRKGLLSMSVNQVGGFVRSRPELALPNLQLYFNPISYDTAPSGKKRTVKPDRFPGFLISFNTCRPTSVGEIHIQSNDDLKPPLIKPNYLSTSADIQDVFEGYRVIRQIAATQPLNRFVLDHHLPNRERVDEAGLLEDFRNRASTVYHACGTASMGKDISNSVVDAKLRVHGVSGLRVVDASIFPNVSSGNTNAPTIMVAEKASDILKKDWHL